MRPFRFALDPVLEVRRRREQQAMEELAMRVGDLQHARRRQAGLQGRLGRQQLPTDPQLYQAHQQYVERLQLELAGAQHETQLAGEAADGARAQAARAQAEREVLESLRRRRQQAWRAEWEQHQQAELEELAMMRRGQR